MNITLINIKNKLRETHMNFDKFENSNFFKSAKIRIDPITLEQTINYLPAFDFKASDCPVKIDTVNSVEKNDDFCTDFHSAIKMTLPNSEVWITEDCRDELYRQLTEVQSLIKYVLNDVNNRKNNNPIQIFRSRLVITNSGLTVHRHHHHAPMTITFCYKFDNNSVIGNEPSHLILGPYNNIVKAYVPNSDKFYFVMKNSPVHGTKTNEWRFWWINDFTELFDIPELPFPKWDHPYLDNINLKL